MHYLKILLGSVFVLIAGFFAYHEYVDWRAADKAYDVAKQRIEDAIAKNTITSLDLSDLAKLRVLPPRISKLNELKSLNLSNTDVAELTPVTKLPLLITLKMRNAHIPDLSSLTASPRLQQIYLGGSQVFELEPLSKINTLAYLDLSNTAIKSLEFTGRMDNLKAVNLYASYAYDGSQNHYQALQSQGVKTTSGSAYRQNYIPGYPYKVQMFLSRIVSNFTDKYAYARKLMVKLKPPRRQRPETGSICVSNITGGMLYFTMIDKEDNQPRFSDLAHNSWFCSNTQDGSKLSIQTEKHGTEFCEIQAKQGKLYTVTEYSAENTCKWE